MDQPPIIRTPPRVEQPGGGEPNASESSGDVPPALSKTEDGCGKPNPGVLQRFMNSKLAVLGAIFFAMMFLGIPLLWRSPKFNNAERVFWTVATIAYSALIFWLFYLVMAWSYSRIFPG